MVKPARARPRAAGQAGPSRVALSRLAGRDLSGGPGRPSFSAGGPRSGPVGRVWPGRLARAGFSGPGRCGGLWLLEEFGLAVFGVGVAALGRVCSGCEGPTFWGVLWLGAPGAGVVRVLGGTGGRAASLRSGGASVRGSGGAPCQAGRPSRAQAAPKPGPSGLAWRVLPIA